MHARLLLAACTLATLAAPAADLPRVAFTRFATGFTSPTVMVPCADGTRAFLVAEQVGVISFVAASGGGRGDVFLDLRPRMVALNKGFDERGLLGLALHPDFKRNRKFYVYYSAPLREAAPRGFNHTSHISEFKCAADGRSADPASERLLLAIDQPQFNHDSGNLLFGPDGFLYIGVGDGGAANDRGTGHAPGGNGQSTATLLGKILRIDVDSGDPYGIPPDNPFVGRDGRDGRAEIFAWGLRNPWGMSFDHGAEPRLFVADVGQNRFEEINIIRKGLNYGWPRHEGYAPFNQDNPNEIAKPDPAKAHAPGLEMPVLAYPHNPGYGEAPAYGISVTGGHVYRGTAIPKLHGIYLFADWTTSWGPGNAGLFAGIPGTGRNWTMAVLPGSTNPTDHPNWITAIARDRAGEIYLLAHGSNAPLDDSGTIWKLVPAP